MKKLLGLIALILTMSGCQPPPEPLSIVGNAGIGFHPVYAQHLVHPEQHPENINVTMLVSDISVVRMLTNNAADVGMLSLDNALALQSRGGDQYCVARVIFSSHGADAVIAGRSFASKLLAGKPIRVGMEDSTLSRYIMARWLQQTGIDDSLIQRRMLVPNGHASALMSNDVDVIITYAPFTRHLIDDGGLVIFSSQDIPDEIIDVMIVRTQTWDEHRERLLEFATVSWDAALANIAEAESEVMETIAKLSELPQPELLSLMSQIKYFSAAASAEFLQQDFEQTSTLIGDQLINAGVIAQLQRLPVCAGILE